MAKDHVGLNGEQMRCTFHAGRFRNCVNKCAAAQYEPECHLYDRPAAQLSWLDLSGAYANADPRKRLRPDAGGDAGAWLWHNHGLREKALAG
jgi:hypothetical protein